VITDNRIVDCGKAGILVGDNKNAHYEDKKWARRGNTVMDCTVAPTRNRIANKHRDRQARQIDQGRRGTGNTSRRQHASRNAVSGGGVFRPAPCVKT